MTTVWVASKMPNGLVLGDNVVLNKPLRINPLDKLQPGYQGPAYPIIAGYALTQVPSEAWDRWYNKNRQSDLVKNCIVFGHAEKMVVEAWCMHHRAVRTGFEA